MVSLLVPVLTLPITFRQPVGLGPFGSANYNQPSLLDPPPNQDPGHAIRQSQNPGHFRHGNAVLFGEENKKHIGYGDPVSEGLELMREQEFGDSI